MENEILDLCIGLDIGTSTTKVVIHPLYADDSFFVVDFGEKITIDDSYLLPTKLAFNENSKEFELPIYREDNNICEKSNLIERLMSKFSKVSISKKPVKQRIYDNLKINFMNEKNGSADLLRVFIALVIKYSQTWFIKTYQDRDFMKNKQILWSINMGIPSAKFSANDENQKYKNLLEEAYLLSKQTTINEYNYRKIPNQELDIEYSVIPEIVATVCSFVTQEDTAAQGLYCAIDIGAGTTDVCSFRIHRNEGVDRYSFFKSSVLELGAEKFNEAIDKDNFMKAFSSQLGGVIWRTRQNRDPNAREWGTYLPVILCGGGSYIKEYQNTIKSYEQNILLKQLNYRGFQGYRHISLPDTKYIYTSAQIDPKRLLVAQGLCFSTDFYDDIKKYYKETEIEDISPQRAKEIEYVTKEMC